MSSSMRAGGIHWAATMDTGGFTAGARKVAADATRLQRELKAIAKMDSPFAQRALADRAVKNDMAREAERLRFQKTSAESFGRAIQDMAAFERQSVAMAATGKKAFGSLRDSVGALFGKQGGFAQMAALAKGGGALMGINVAADSMKRLAEGTTEVMAAMSGENWTFGQKFEAFAQNGMKSVPVLDKIFEAGTRVRDMFEAMANGGKTFAEQAKDAERFAAVIDNLRGTTDALTRNIRDIGGKSPFNAIREQFQDNVTAINLARDSTADMSPDQRQQADAAYRTAFVKAEQLRDRQLEALKVSQSGWDPLAGVKRAWGRGANEAGNIKRMAENAITGYLFDYEKGVEEATKRWKDRFATFGNTLRHEFNDIMRRGALFNEAEAARKAKRADFVDGALGIYERLKDEQNAPVRFAPADVLGSQGEYSARMQHQFSGSIMKSTNAELAKKAVELHQKNLDENKRVTRLLEKLVAAAENVTVATF